MEQHTRQTSLEETHRIAALEQHLRELETANRQLRADLDALRHTEASLREREARYRTFISNTFIGIWRVETHRPIPTALPVEAQIDWIYEHVYFAECNDASARMYGFDTAEEVVGQLFGAIMPRTEPANVAVVRRIIEAGYQVNDDEWVEVNGAGQPLITLNNIVSIIEAGYVTQAWGVQIDITARRQAEETSEKYRKMLDGAEKIAQIGSFEWDVALNQLMWSDELYRIYGIDPTRFEATFEAFFNAVHPDDRALLRNTLYEAADARAAFQMEERILRPDGDLRHLVTRGEVITDEVGNPVRMIGVCQDITARKQVEERLRRSEELHRKNEARLAEAQRIAHLGNWEWDLATDHQHWSDELYRIYGLEAKPEAVTYQTFLDLVHPDDLAYVKRTTEAIVDGKPQSPLEFRIIRPDGVIRIVSGEATLFCDETGRPSRVAGTAQDITERKKAEAERKKFIQELNAKNAELERFVYTASHDLKTPLVTIKGFAGLLEKDAAAGDTEEVKAHLDRIKAAADKMGRLLQELLELSRIGRLFNPLENVALTDLAHEAATGLAEQIEARGVIVEIADTMPVIFGDRHRLSEVFHNVIDNAIKFMGDQPKPRITIGARLDKDAALCRVHDNGMGIADAYHEKIFGLFEQLDQRADGTGIGLALVKRIVEVHGGRVWVESGGLGHGAALCFTLPLRV